MEHTLDKVIILYCHLLPLPLVVLDLQSVSDHYYFLHESDNSKMIIYNLVDGYWSVVVSNGSNFPPSNGQLVNPVTFATIVTYSREGYDDTGRA